jgi:hypothetical protein
MFTFLKSVLPPSPQRSRALRLRPSVECLETRLLPSADQLAPVVDHHAASEGRNIVERMQRHPPAPPYSGSRKRFEKDPAHFRIDSRGVITTWVGPAQRFVYLPTTVARYVLGLYNSWRQGDDSALPRMRTNALWLQMHARPRVSGQHRFLIHYIGVGEASFQVSRYATSALTAGHTMIALHAAGLALNDGLMLRQARRILPGFAANIQDGGYRLQLGRRSSWFEEYSEPGVTPPRVLNGHIWAVIDLDWYARVAGDRMARKLSILGINALRQSVAAYSDSPISAYDLSRRGQICGYHYADIALLRIMYRMTGIDTFRKHADTWARQKCS